MGLSLSFLGHSLGPCCFIIFSFTHSLDCLCLNISLCIKPSSGPGPVLRQGTELLFLLREAWALHHRCPVRFGGERCEGLGGCQDPGRRILRLKGESYQHQVGRGRDNSDLSFLDLSLLPSGFLPANPSSQALGLLCPPKLHFQGAWVSCYHTVCYQ